MSIFDDQADFMAACGQTVDRFNAKQANMYAELIREETEEFKEAFAERDIADAIIDIIVVCIGYGLSRGWPMKELWDAVHVSNMAKVDTKTGLVTRRSDGKILKPTGWAPPNLQRVLDEHEARNGGN